MAEGGGRKHAELEGGACCSGCTGLPPDVMHLVMIGERSKRLLYQARGLKLRPSTPCGWRRTAAGTSVCTLNGMPLAKAINTPITNPPRYQTAL